MDRGEEIDLGDVSGALTDAQREEFIKKALAAKGIAGSPGLVQMMQDKLDRLVGKSSGYLESLPKKVKNRVENLKKLQDEHDELEEQYLKEKAELEAKYNAKYAPLYEKRAAIVAGEVEPEMLPPKEGEEEKPEATSSEGAKEEDVKGIPNFWLTALRNNMTIEETISEKDEGALEYLRDIKWTPLEGQKGFTLNFYFAPNPYFTNSVLSKSYYMVEDEEPILERAEGTEINWQAGKNLTQKLLRKKPKKGSKNTKPQTKTEQVASFFNFFSPPTIPEEDMDETEAEELQDLMEADYDVGSALKEKIIPHAVEWFTGEAVELEDEDYDEDDLDDVEEGDEEDEDDDEDDEDDDEDDAPPRARKGPGAARLPARQKGAQATGKAGEQPPECKQQ